MIHKKSEKKLLPKWVSLALNGGFYCFVIMLVVVSFIFSQSNSSSKSFLKFRFYNVVSYSMEGMISKGSLVIVKEVSPESLAKNDVITFKTDEKGSDRVTHQIVDVVKGANGIEGFVTRGYANDSNDPEPVTPDLLLGKVVFHAPVIGSIFLYLNQHFIWVIVSFAVIAVLVLVIYLILKKKGLFVRPKRKDEQPEHKNEIGDEYRMLDYEVALFDDIIGDKPIKQSTASEIPIKDDISNLFEDIDSLVGIDTTAANTKDTAFLDDTATQTKQNIKTKNTDEHIEQQPININQNIASLLQELQSLFLQDSNDYFKNTISSYKKKNEQTIMEIQAALLKIKEEQEDLVKELESKFGKF